MKINYIQNGLKNTDKNTVCIAFFIIFTSSNKSNSISIKQL